MKRFFRLAIGTLMAAALFLRGASAFALAKVVYHGNKEVRKIAITMDDCWRLGVVERMLDLCKEYDFRMTFFPCGTVIHEEDRDLWLRMIAEGHEIGNHTQNHKKLTNLSDRLIGDELRFMENRLNKALGYTYPIRLMRPPYGSGAWGETGRAIYKSGYQYIILWSISETDPNKMLRMVHNGDILLYHSNGQDVYGLRKAIPILLERGFQLVTVSELLGLPPQSQEATPSCFQKSEESCAFFCAFRASTFLKILVAPANIYWQAQQGHAILHSRMRGGWAAACRKA